mmetsp:Transcript_12883/g.25967  ORF Transcript_12883/g.25967 Transcript_12883/m.25967 type:complete len:105 (-) Transcript_12883:804-1118(-)
MVCAVDMGFMSTSRNRDTPITYMAEGSDNVLWEIEPGEEDDSAYHCGADISRISQFAKEQEVLFPPCVPYVQARPLAAPYLQARRRLLPALSLSTPRRRKSHHS